MPDAVNPFQSPEDDARIKDVLLSVDVWRMARCGIGVARNLDGPAGDAVPGLHLHLVGDTDPDGPQPPPEVDVVVRMLLDDLTELLSELGSAMHPVVRRAVAESWLSLDEQ